MADPFELYFRDYASAYDAFDAERIAAFFHCPCLMVNCDLVVSLTTPHAILSNMRGLLAYHRKQGVGRASVSDIEAREQAANLAIVEVRWRVFRGDESLLWSWSNSYNLVNYDDVWRILVSTTHEPDAVRAPA